MHAFSDVHLHLMLFVDVFPCFPFHFDFVYQPYIGYMLRYTSCIYMYKRAGTSDILTFVKGSLVEKLPIYEQDRRVIVQSSHSSVKSQLSQVIVQSSHSSVK